MGLRASTWQILTSLPWGGPWSQQEEKSRGRSDQFFAMENLIANELQRLNDKTAHDRTYLSDAFSVVRRIVEKDGELGWGEIEEKNGNHAIYQCIPVCKLFGAAYAVARDLGLIARVQPEMS